VLLHTAARIEKERARELDYSDERNYLQGIRVYDLSTGTALRTFGRRGDNLYNLTPQLHSYTLPSPSSSSSLSSPEMQLVFRRTPPSGPNAGSSPILASTGMMNGGATFWDALHGCALNTFSLYPEGESHASVDHGTDVPPLVLTLLIDELLILYECVSLLPSLPTLPSSFSLFWAHGAHDSITTLVTVS